MPRSSIAGFLASLILLIAAAGQAAADLKVVVTIKPIHALVAEVMRGVAAPELLVRGTASPHTYALRPSEARRLHHADIFFRISEAVEPFTARLVASLPRAVEVVTLQHTPGLELLARRTGSAFEPHSHAADAPEPALPIDGHIWLDPGNAKLMAGRIAQALGAADPAHAALFEANARALEARLDDLAALLERLLRPLSGKPYIVSHDALQYFEHRYQLNAVGSILVSPEVPPSAKHLADLRRKIVSSGALCVFAEPQSDRRLVENLIEGTAARTGTLDPEGSRLEPGPELYFTLMRKLADDLKACLAPPA